jgi:hypothetical protein
MFKRELAVKSLPPRAEYDSPHEAIEAAKRSTAAEFSPDSMNLIKGPILRSAHIGDTNIQLGFSCGMIVEITVSAESIAACRAVIMPTPADWVSGVLVAGDCGDVLLLKWSHRTESKEWKRRALIDSIYERKLVDMSSHDFGVSLHFSDRSEMIFSTIEIIDVQSKLLFWSAG